jgi:peptidyl-prolyl cis-trans isomerase SurA
MKKHLLLTAGFICLLSTFMRGQSEDPVLFNVNNIPVHVSEFKYIYNKNNQDKADYTEKSLRDYLDLYVQFKLKVQKAKDMKLDTLSSLRSELEGYRRQLAKSYLEDKEVTDKLIHETFDRMQQDVDISHIFVVCDRNAKAVDTLKAYNKALRLMQAVKSGKPFNQVATDSSEDKSAKENHGNLGYITAMLPDGYYSLEKAIYLAKPGAVIGPIRSNSGYHVVLINSFRPARGEVEVAQILFRKSDNIAKNAAQKMKADSVFNLLKTGSKWDDLSNKFSEDKVTAPKGGYVGFFGINRYQKSFEDAAFALDKDGDYTQPIETSIGFHIIKRISRRAIGSYEVMKRPLTERVKRDSRSEIARQSMIGRIKKEGNFQEYPSVLATWSSHQIDSIFLTFKWKADPAKPQDVLMRFNGNKQYTVADFEDYCTRSGRDRMRGAGFPLGETVQKLYKGWTDEVALSFEESQLDKKYPDFHSLMREYEDGIMLFEALKINVWDRANTDSVGLEKYFTANLSQKYKWDERAKVSIYTLKSDDANLLKELREFAAKKPSDVVLKKFNKKDNILTVIEKTYEKGKNKDLTDIWTAGGMTAPKTDAGTKTSNFTKVESILPPTPKTLTEARGYAVADYQDYLEKQWIEELRKAYPVKIDESVLKGMVKK